MANENALPEQTLIVDWTFTGLGLMGLGFLITSRLTSKVAHLGLDDFLVVFVWLLGLGLVSQTTWAIKREEQARHQADVSQSDLEKAAMSLMVNEALWTAINTALRVSAWLFILRIFDKWAKIISKASIVICLCHGAASMLELFLVCRPIAANWDPTVVGVCGDILVSYVFMESVGLVLDIFILIIPLVFLFRLRMDVRKKCGIAAVFEAGWVIFIVTGLRLRALRLAVSPDYTWSESYLGMLSAVGCMVGVFLCSVPGMPNIFRSLRVAKIGSTFYRAFSSRMTRTHTSMPSQWEPTATVQSHQNDVSTSTDDAVVVTVKEVDEGSVSEQDDTVHDLEALEVKTFQFRRSYTV